MQLTDKFSYDKCKNKVKYQIKHQDIPISLSKELREAIYYLLWYVPNIKSEQSEKNELLTNPQYDDFIFLEIMKSMNLSDEDVLYTESITEKMISPFLEEICIKCPKIIMTISSGETKTMALLRHIRNAIAHGNFNVIGDMVVGFDLQRYENHIEYRGFFKINPNNLLDALRKIQFDYNSQQLISKAFKNTGYFIQVYQEKYQRSHDFELFARKNNKKYAIDIKNYKYEKIVDQDFIREMINQYEGLIDDITPILIINTSFLDKKSKEELLCHDVIVLDVKNIQKMVKGRDMVAEIERAQLFKN
ncbi:hypothetical protein JNO63_07425 [Anaerococcus sp. mt242]|uniref:restriction endonuclease n=1 Tax=Anaerococcus sp. mt242 TaxID=2661917 RepID=UPI0019328A7E|nr:restriction endonuclease [Anaerococcus sp. mt242]MBM0046922.1 hypothetical protein [Anaerococcus sp. mt242]